VSNRTIAASAVSKPFALDRVVCGDAATVMRTMPAASVHLIMTSPPYNVGVAYDGSSDTRSYGDYLSVLGSVWREVPRILVPGGRLVVNVSSNWCEGFLPVHHDVAAQLRIAAAIPR
jgi:DNA modification methylase